MSCCSTEYPGPCAEEPSQAQPAACNCIPLSVVTVKGSRGWWLSSSYNCCRLQDVLGTKARNSLELTSVFLDRRIFIFCGSGSAAVNFLIFWRPVAQFGLGAQLRILD